MTKWYVYTTNGRYIGTYTGPLMELARIVHITKFWIGNSIGVEPKS